MKQQLLQSREALIQHLEEKIAQLKQKRKELLNNRFEQQPTQPETHVNVQAYLKNQAVSSSNQNKSQGPAKKPNLITFQQVPHRSKADIVREQKETKQKLQTLKEMYEKKRQLESIGIYENNPQKIKNMYQSKDSKKKIDRKVTESKKKIEAKVQKDKIIRQEMAKVQKFLQESKIKDKKQKQTPANHYSKLIEDQKLLQNYERLLFKKHMTLAEKQNLLEYTFGLIKDPMGFVDKSTVKNFLLSNPEFCTAFCVTKVQVLRDVQVHPTANPGQFSFQQFYEIIKSIEITNKALYPNLNYKSASEAAPLPKPVKNSTTKVNVQLEKQKQMQKYLKSLFVWLDQKSEKIVERDRFQLSLKKTLLFDQKKYPNISKEDIAFFSATLSKKRQKLAKSSYYQSLDMKYIGLQEILTDFKQHRTNPQSVQEQQSEKPSQTEEPQYQQDQDQLEPQYQQNQSATEIPLTPTLQHQDLQKYGWKVDIKGQETFGQLKQLDSYYKEMGNKYGNEISWNGFNRYREDFTKFNECIKQMNEAHQQSSTK